MPAVLTSGVAEKAAGDAVRIPMDFGNIQQLIDGALIVSYDVTCSTPGAPTISSKQLDYSYQVSALFSGGTPSPTPYDIVFSITLDDGDSTTIVRTGPLRIL